LPANTGYVYYTTQKKVNEIHCKRIFPLNATQLVEVREFFDLLNRLKTEGGAFPEFPIVGTNVPVGGSTGAVAGTSTGGTPSKTPKAGEEGTSGRISLRDLLATVPSVGGTTTATGTEGAVAGAVTERGGGLAAVAEALAEKMNTSTTNAYVIIFLMFLALILIVIYGILRSIEPKEEEEVKVEVEKFDVRKDK
jgi:hypothetical protein